MTAPRFHCSTPLSGADVGGEVLLPDAVTHHALRVLRMAVGDDLTLFTGAGGEFAATLKRADKRNAWAQLARFDPVEREGPLDLTLVLAIIANDAMDQAVRHAVELGVSAIQPVLSARSARLPSGERGDKRLAHWRQIVVAACEQCGRNRLPPVHAVLALDHWLAARAPGRAGRILAPLATSGLPPEPADGPLDLCIGPEGGFTEDEIALALRAGIQSLRLGPRVLRAETAALTALAAVGARHGDLR